MDVNRSFFSKLQRCSTLCYFVTPESFCYYHPYETVQELGGKVRIRHLDNLDMLPMIVEWGSLLNITAKYVDAVDNNYSESNGMLRPAACTWSIR